MPITVIDTTDNAIVSDSHYEDRVNLAACFRMSARLGLNEGVGNHFSYAISEDGQQFLMNPFGRHFSNIRASDLMLLDANDERTMERAHKPDPTAWAIHGAMHRNVSQARCVMHLHSKYATVLATLADSRLPPVDQNAMRFFNRVTIDDGFDGMGLDQEGERLSTMLGENRVMVMGSHGVMVVGETIARTFDELFYFERACENYIIALTTGKALRVASDVVAEKTAQQWDEICSGSVGFADAHLAQMREILDREEPDYKL